MVGKKDKNNVNSDHGATELNLLINKLTRRVITAMTLENVENVKELHYFYNTCFDHMWIAKRNQSKSL